MNQPKREWLKERHRFSEWAGRSELPKDRRVEQPALAGSDLPGWTLERAERREAAPAPARHTSFWRRENADEVVRVDLFACASVDAAHEYLVDALGEFESSAVRRRTDGVGDVAFGLDTVALFARGNVVVVVRSAGRPAVPVTAIAQAVDAIILGQLR
jgi:hypothetical protein